MTGSRDAIARALRIEESACPVRPEMIAVKLQSGAELLHVRVAERVMRRIVQRRGLYGVPLVRMRHSEPPATWPEIAQRYGVHVSTAKRVVRSAAYWAECNAWEARQ